MDAARAHLKACGTVASVFLGFFGFLDARAEEAVGTLSAVVGKAEVTRGGQTQKATKGMEIFSTDFLQTSPKTAVKIQFKDGSSFMAFENSQVKIEEYQIKAGKGNGVSVKSAFDIAKGKVRFFVKPKEEGNSNDVAFKTANAVMGIRGTSGVIDASTPGRTQLVVLTGKVEVSNPANPGARVYVAASQMTDVVGRQAPLAPRVAPPALLKQAGVDADAAESQSSKSSSDKPAGEGAKDHEGEKKDGASHTEQGNSEAKSDGAAPSASEEGGKPAGKSDEGQASSPKDEKKGTGSTSSAGDGSPSKDDKSNAPSAQDDKTPPAKEGKSEAASSKDDKAAPSKEGKPEPSSTKEERKPSQDSRNEESGKGAAPVREEKPTSAASETREEKAGADSRPAAATSGNSESATAPKTETKRAETTPARDASASEKPAAVSPKMEKKVVFTPEGKSAVIVTGNTNLQKVVAPPPVISTIRIQETQPTAMKTIQTQATQVTTVTTAIEQRVISSIEPQRQVIVVPTPTPAPVPTTKSIKIRVQLPTSP